MQHDIQDNVTIDTKWS